MRRTRSVRDRASQVRGGGGVSDDCGLVSGWALARTLHLADGADEVYIDQIAYIELRKETKPWTQSFLRIAQ